MSQWLQVAKNKKLSLGSSSRSDSLKIRREERQGWLVVGFRWAGKLQSVALQFSSAGEW